MTIGAIDPQTELRLLTDHAPVMMVHCDTHQRFVFVNRAYSQRFNLPPESVQGRTVAEVLGPVAYSRIRPHIETVLRGQTLEFELEVPYEHLGIRMMHCVYRPHLDADGRPLGFIATLEDVTARVRAEQALQAREKQHRLLLEGVPQLVWTCQPDGHCDYLSPQWTAYTGVPERDHLGFAWLDALHPDDRARVFAEWQQASRHSNRFETDFRIRSAAGQYRWFTTRAVRVEDADGTRRWFGTNTDIHDKRMAEEELRALTMTLERRVAERTAALQESEARFRSALEHAAIGMALVSTSGRWIKVNRAMCELLGYPEDELLDRDYKTITHEDDIPAQRKHLAALMSGEVDSFSMEKRYLHRLGHIVQAVLSASIVRSADGQPLYFVTQLQDITARKHAEAQMAQSLREKEVLLREVHHRVKNNLAVIGSLFYLQALEADDPAVARVFEDSQDRTRSIAMVHELLYKSPDLSHVDFAQYLTHLVDHLREAHRSSAQILVDTMPLVLDISIAVPCGLIVNELVMNALKHAFDGHADEILHVGLTSGDGAVRLTVADNGRGLPADFDGSSPRTLGMRLIQALTQQLDGEIRFTGSAGGTRATLSFSLPPEEEVAFINRHGG